MLKNILQLSLLSNAKVICIAIVLLMYLAVFITCLKYFNFFTILFSKVVDKSRIGKKYKCIYDYVLPMYRKEYFGYEYIMLRDSRTILYPSEHFRVFGVIHPNSECLLIVSKDTLKSIIVLSDTRLVDEAMEWCRILFRNLIIIFVGGILIWQICSRYMI